MPYGYPTGQPGGAGATLTGFADTYLRARKQFADEDAEQQVARYRQLQSEQMQQEIQSSQSAQQGIETLAGQPPAEPQTLVEGQPPTPGTPAQNPQQTPDQGAAAGGSPSGGAAPGEPGGAAGPNAAPTGMPPTPGKPGLPPIQQQIRTYQDAIKALPGGAKQLADMLKSPQGRQQLQALGYLSPAEVDQRRQVAAIDQAGRGFDADIDTLARSGKPEDVTAYHFKLAAKYEYMAQAASDPTTKEHYRQAMDRERGLAVDLRSDQNTREEAAGLRQDFYQAAQRFDASGSQADYESALGILAKMQTNKSTAAEAQHLLAGFQKRNSDLLGDPDLQGERQIRAGVTSYINDHPGTTPQDAWANVVKQGSGNPQILQAAIKDAVTSQDPAKLVALGLPPKLKSDEYDLAAFQTASDGVNPGQPGWADKVTQHLKANHEARTNGTFNTLAARELTDQISALDEQIQDKQQEYDGFKADGTLGTPEAQQAAKDLAGLKAERQKRADYLIQVGGRQGAAGRVGGSLGAERLQDSRDKTTLATLDKAVKSFEDRKKATGDYFMMRPAEKAAFDADYAAAKKKRDDFAGKIQAKSGVVSPPASTAPSPGKGQSPVGPNGMPMDKAPVGLPEGKKTRGSDGKIYQNVGGWMQLVR